MNCLVERTGRTKQRNVLVNFCDADKCWGGILVIQISVGLDQVVNSVQLFIQSRLVCL